jgi:DNA (cytosine-5)-methyltransferase 1
MPDGSVNTPDIRDAERLQGFDDDWTVPAIGVGRASFRWSLVGNAVTVPVAEWVGRRLQKPGLFDEGRSRKFPDTGRWPRAARFDGSRRSAVEIGALPIWNERTPLHRFLRCPGTPLSARATKGFLSRTEVSSLRFPEGFLDILRAHLGRMKHAPVAISRRRSVGDHAKAA